MAWGPVAWPRPETVAFGFLSYLRGERPEHKTGRTIESDELILDPRRMAEVFEEINAHHALVAVHPEGCEDDFNSAILKVDAAQKYLLMDELNDKQAHQRLLQSRRLFVFTRLKGVDISFTGEVTEVGEQNGIAFYHIPFPQELTYKQRRHFHRLAVPMGVRIPFQLLDEREHFLHGEVNDLSIGGFSGRLTSPHGEAMEKGKYFPRCVLTLPEDKKIITSLELCYSLQWYKVSNLNLGARFMNLEPGDQRRIEQYIRKTEREIRRRKLQLES